MCVCMYVKDSGIGVYMYVCVYECMKLRPSATVSKYVSTMTYVCMYVCVCMYVYICMYVCMYVWVYVKDSGIGVYMSI
jgi:hypothetical protein